MRTIIFIVAIFTGLLIAFSSCRTPDAEVQEVVQATKPSVETFEKFTDLLDAIDQHNGELQVINFWMTSCPPCVKEMPYFNQLEKEYPTEEVDVLLVSLDRKRDMDKRVLPFIEKHQIKSRVVLLEDQNYSEWTGIVDSDWFGALPATLFLKGGKRHFKFGAYHSYDELKADYTKMQVSPK